MEPLTLTHQPHRVIQGTLSWALDPGGGLETYDTLSKPPHALHGWRVLEPEKLRTLWLALSPSTWCPGSCFTPQFGLFRLKP